MPHPNHLTEVCAACGLVNGSHHAGTSPWPYNYCPGTEGFLDWEKGPGTVFVPSGEYRKKIYGKKAEFTHRRLRTEKMDGKKHKKKRYLKREDVLPMLKE